MLFYISVFRNNQDIIYCSAVAQSGAEWRRVAQRRRVAQSGAEWRSGAVTQWLELRILDEVREL